MIECSYIIIDQTTHRHPWVSDGTIANFLHKHLEKYRDSVENIQNAIDYVFEKSGGMVILQMHEDQLVGAVILNKTGMQGYIPENILVYIAIDSNFRGKGLGKVLMQKAITSITGDIALHVEANNPAKKLYEKLGFTNPYLEMRLKR